MESSRFDAFAHALDRALSRRGALAALLGTLPASLLGPRATAGKGQRRRGNDRTKGTAKHTGKGRPRAGQEQVPSGTLQSCDPAACAASGGCCQGSTCVRHAGQWSPQLTFGSGGSDPNQFVSPLAIAVSADERTAWVAEQFRIKVWVRSGDDWVFQTQLGSRGDRPDQFQGPGGVAASGDGQTLWVTDTGNARISVWTRSGNTWVPQTTFGSKGKDANEFDEPLGIAVSPDGQTVWVADQDNHRISVWTRSGSGWAHQTTFGSGRGRGPNQFDNPTGIAVSADGQTAVVGDTGNFRISVWTKSGNTWVNQATFGGGRDQFDNPRGVNISPDGQTIWVADAVNNRISVWAKSGNTWVNRTTFGSKGKGLDELDKPWGVAVSANGRTVWVADTSNHRISVWASGSPFIWGNQATFGSKGSRPNQFDMPHGVAVSGDGKTAWVADLQNHRIAVWARSNATNWALQTTFGSKGDGPNQFDHPADIAVAADGQTVWVSDISNNRISVWAKSGNSWIPQTTFGSRGSGPSQFRNPQGLAISADGQTLWVADQDNHRVAVWIKSGNTWVNQTAFGSKGKGPNQFEDPWDVAVSGDGQAVWVADLDNDRISVWVKSGGSWVNQTIFGSRGEEFNQFENPRGVAASADGRTVWVADFQNHRISVWTKSRSSGNWMPQTAFGGFGGGPNELRFPSSVALSADEETVWIADTTNNRISIWALICPPA